MEKILRKIRPLYLAVGIILLLVVLAAGLYFLFVKNDVKEHNRGTYVLSELSLQNTNNVYSTTSEAIKGF